MKSVLVSAYAVLMAIVLGSMAVIPISSPDRTSSGGAFADLACTGMSPVGPTVWPGSTTTGRPWTLAYLAEGYMNPATFAGDVSRLTTPLGADNYFGAYVQQGRFQRVDVALKSCTNGVSTPGHPTTALGLEANNDPARCYYDLTDEFSRRVGLAVKGITDLKSIVVVANRPEIEGDACTFGDLLVITNAVDRDTLMHEFGHLVAGLFDETDGTSTSLQTIAGPNCASIGTGLSWLPGQEGCDQFENLRRPGDACRMRDSRLNRGNLCTPCSGALSAALDAHYGLPPSDASVVQLVVRFYRSGGHWRNEVVAVEEYAGSLPADTEVRGDYVISVSGEDGRATCLASPPQDARGGRAYRQSESGATGHTRAATDGLIAILQCPRSAFAGVVPAAMAEYPSLKVHPLRPGTRKRISVPIFRGWMTDPDSPVLER